MEYRFATKDDTKLILKFIKDLAEYEGLLDEVVATEEILDEWIFNKKKAEVLFIQEDNKEIGFALFFSNFSTFLGRAGLYLEDLYIMPEYRHKGYGKALIKELAKIAKDRGYGRFEWWCLDSNTPSIKFYKDLGAVDMNEWTVYRLTKDKIDEIAGE